MWIYRLTNNMSGKIYIGRTTNITKRISKHRWDKRNTAISSAIQKYGFENFSICILFYGQTTEDELNRLERFWIAKLGSADPLKGYNLTIGGDGIVGRKYPTGVDHPSYGKTRSQETKAKLRKAHLGRKMSQESRRKKSEATKGRPLAEAHRAKLAAINKLNVAKRFTEEGLENMKKSARRRASESPSPLIGRPKSPEQVRRSVEAKARNRLVRAAIAAEGRGA